MKIVTENVKKNLDLVEKRVDVCKMEQYFEFFFFWKVNRQGYMYAKFQVKSKYVADFRSGAKYAPLDTPGKIRLKQTFSTIYVRFL